CGTVARTLFPGMQIIGVEPETANDTWLSIEKGEGVTIPPPPTIADGVRLTTPGERTFPILQQTLSDVALVTDDEIRAALRYLVLRAHVVVEPTGAVAAAAVLSAKLPLERGARVGVILSGGNIDPPLLSEILQTTGRAQSAPVKGGNDLAGQARDLLFHHGGRDHRAGDELGAAGAHVFFESLDEDLGRPEGRALGQRLVIDPAARDERRGGGMARGAIAREAEVDERAEVVGGGLPAGLGGQGPGLLHAHPEAPGPD